MTAHHCDVSAPDGHGESHFDAVRASATQDILAVLVLRLAKIALVIGGRPSLNPVTFGGRVKVSFHRVVADDAQDRIDVGTAAGAGCSRGHGHPITARTTASVSAGGLALPTCRYRLVFVPWNG